MMVYSAADVIQRVADGRLKMGDLASRRLNQHQVVIEVQNNTRFNILSAPERYSSDGLIDTLLHSFTLPEYAVRIRISEKLRRSMSIQSFFTFLESRDYPTKTYNNKGKAISLALPAYCFNDWETYLRENYNDKAVWRYMLTVRKVLGNTLIKLYGKASNWPKAQKEAWQVLNANTPKNPGHEKTPPLGMYLGIPATEFSNQELQLGLRYGVIWLLQRLQKQRSAFVAEPVIAESLAELKGSTLEKYQQSFMTLDKYLNNVKNTINADNNERLARISSTTWRVIRNDPLLTEWQFYTNNKLRPVILPENIENNRPFSAKVQDLLLSRFVKPDGSLAKRATGFGRNDIDWTPLRPMLGMPWQANIGAPCRWGLNWLVHCQLEKLLMVWLLASERAQRSGISKLRFSEVRVANRELQISTIKTRRAASPSAKLRSTEVETSIYKISGAVGSVYYTWLQQAQKAQAAISQYNQDNRYIYGENVPLGGVIIGNNVKDISQGFLPLELLSVPGTVWYETFHDESKGIREAQAFTAILANRIAAKRASPKKNIALPPGPIGQSLVVEQELENNRVDTLSAVENEAVGHGEATGRNVYKDGFARLGVNEILEPVRAFARKVGDGKVELAWKIADRLNQNSRPVSLEELEQLCGIASARSNQQDLLSRLDVQDKLTITGELNIGDQLLVVQTDLTAAMMWGYIRHLESQLPELMASDRNKTTLRHLAQYLHLSEVWKRFDSSLQQAGKKLSNEMQFPFPPLN